MLNLYMNNRGATKGKRGTIKAVLSIIRKKQVVSLKFLNLTLLMTDVATRYCQLHQKE